jgi:large subunit ribosomal protein L15
VKLHDLKPAPGSRRPKRRVGRGIAAGQGKTAGRGTKGQKARAGGKIPAWFEGGQTPLHQRLPKLHGFRNPFRIEYEVVNLGAIAHLVELGVLESGEMPGTKRAKGGTPAPITVNQEILRASGLVRTLDKPLKVLGGGELSTALFVVADAFSASARSKIEAAGGTVSMLEVPSKKRAALKTEASATDEMATDAATTDATATDAAATEATAADAAAASSDQDAQEAVPDGAEAANAELASAPKPRSRRGTTDSVYKVEVPSDGEAVVATTIRAYEEPQSSTETEPAAKPAADDEPAPRPKKPRASKKAAATEDPEADDSKTGDSATDEA